MGAAVGRDECRRSIAALYPLVLRQQRRVALKEVPLALARDIKSYVIYLTSINIDDNNINLSNIESKIKEVEENLVDDILFIQDNHLKIANIILILHNYYNVTTICA